MGKLYQRYKRNGRQVSDFEKAEYVEVEKNSEDIEDVAPKVGENNQLQLESVDLKEILAIYLINQKQIIIDHQMLKSSYQIIVV